MSSNLFHIVRDELDGQTLGNIDDIVQMPSSQVGLAINCAISAILTGLSHFTLTNRNSGIILKLISDAEDIPLDRNSNRRNEDENNSISNSGFLTLSDSVGNESSYKLTNAVSDFSAIDNASAKSLLGLLTPIIFAVLKRKLRSEGDISLHNLQSLFSAQSSNIHSALPDGFENELSSFKNSNQIPSSPDISRGQRRHHQPTLFGKIFPAALSIATLLLGYNMFTNTNVDLSLMKATTKTELHDPSTTLKSVIQDITNSLESITDQATAKAALPELEEASVDLERLAELIKHLPGATTQQPFINIVSNDLSATQKMLHEVHQFPEVTPVLKITTDELLAKLALLE